MGGEFLGWKSTKTSHKLKNDWCFSCLRTSLQLWSLSIHSFALDTCFDLLNSIENLEKDDTCYVHQSVSYWSFSSRKKKLKEYYVIGENVIWKSVILICCSQKWICLSSETTSIHYVCIHGMSNPAQVEWSSHLQLGESFQWLHKALLLGWWASPSTMNQWEFGPQARVFVISKFLHFYIFYLLNRSTGEMWSQSWHGSKKKWPNQYPKKPVWWRSGGGCVHTVAFSTPKLKKRITMVNHSACLGHVSFKCCLKDCIYIYMYVLDTQKLGGQIHRYIWWNYCCFFNCVVETTTCFFSTHHWNTPQT